jgi:hypothetical protein
LQLEVNVEGVKQDEWARLRWNLEDRVRPETDDWPISTSWADGVGLTFASLERLLAERDEARAMAVSNFEAQQITRKRAETAEAEAERLNARIVKLEALADVAYAAWDSIVAPIGAAVSVHHTPEREALAEQLYECLCDVSWIERPDWGAPAAPQED